MAFFRAYLVTILKDLNLKPQDYSKRVFMQSENNYSGRFAELNGFVQNIYFFYQVWWPFKVISFYEGDNFWKFPLFLTTALLTN